MNTGCNGRKLYFLPDVISGDVWIRADGGWAIAWRRLLPPTRSPSEPQPRIAPW